MSGEELVLGPSSFCRRSSVSVGGRAWSPVCPLSAADLVYLSGEGTGSPLQLFLFSFYCRSNASVGGRAGSPLPPCLGTNEDDVCCRGVGSAFITVLCRLQVCMGNVQVQGFILSEHGLGPLRNLTRLRVRPRRCSALP